MSKAPVHKPPAHSPSEPKRPAPATEGHPRAITTNVPILTAVPIVEPNGTEYLPAARTGDRTPYRVSLPIGEFVRPLMDEAASAGNSVRFSRGDHVHPTDTTRAPRMGVTDGSEAGAGEIGEHISTLGQPAAALTALTNVPMDLTAISLTAGDWDVMGQAATQIASGGHVQHMQAWTNTVSKTIPTQLVGSLHEIGGVATGGTEQLVLPTGRMRLNLTATTTVYLSTLIQFTGTGKAMGYISARRVR